MYNHKSFPCFLHVAVHIMASILNTNWRPPKNIAILLAVSCTAAVILLRKPKRTNIVQHLLSIVAQPFAFIKQRFEPPQLHEVLFTNRRSICCVESVSPHCRNDHCKTRNELRIIELINAARRTLSISMYMFTCKRLGNAVVAAHQRGVRVRVIGCKSMAYSTSSQLLRLSQLGR